MTKLIKKQKNCALSKKPKFGWISSRVILDSNIAFCHVPGKIFQFFQA